MGSGSPAVECPSPNSTFDFREPSNRALLYLFIFSLMLILFSLHVPPHPACFVSLSMSKVIVRTLAPNCSCLPKSWQRVGSGATGFLGTHGSGVSGTPGLRTQADLTDKYHHHIIYLQSILYFPKFPNLLTFHFYWHPRKEWLNLYFKWRNG